MLNKFKLGKIERGGGIRKNSNANGVRNNSNSNGFEEEFKFNWTLGIIQIQTAA
jgi:hypothetical protein